MNRAEILGRLVNDPTLRAVGSGAFLSEFVVATEDAHMGEIRTAFVGCIAWGATAERVGEQYKKGDELYVLGALVQREIEKRDGGKERKTKIEATLVSRTQVALRNEPKF